MYVSYHVGIVQGAFSGSGFSSGTSMNLSYAYIHREINFPGHRGGDHVK